MCNQKETAFRPVIDIIEKESKSRLNSTLHLVVYYHNPYDHYKDRAVQNNILVRTTVMHCICVIIINMTLNIRLAHMNSSYIRKNEICSYEFLIYKEKFMESGITDRYRTGFSGMDNFDLGNLYI